MGCMNRLGLQMSGAEGKVMEAIKCDPQRPDKMNDVEQMFLQSGVKPVEFPRIH